MGGRAASHQVTNTVSWKVGQRATRVRQLLLLIPMAAGSKASQHTGACKQPHGRKCATCLVMLFAICCIPYEKQSLTPLLLLGVGVLSRPLLSGSCAWRT